MKQNEPGMSTTGAEESYISLRLPTLTVRDFVFGMTAMNVVNGIMILFVMCFFPLGLTLIAGIRHPSVFKLHILFVLLLAVGISFGLNALFIGTWCFRGLFMSLNRRIIASIILLVWHVLLWFLNQADYLDIGLVAALLVISSWDGLQVGREHP
jgi:hypothetical protein